MKQLTQALELSRQFTDPGIARDYLMRSVEAYITDPPKTLAEISAKYGISQNTLQRRAEERGIGMLYSKLRLVDSSEIELLITPGPRGRKPKSEKES